MNTASSIVSKMFALIALCAGALVVGSLLISADPAHASTPQATSLPKSSADQYASRRLSVNDWVMMTKSLSSTPQDTYTPRSASDKSTSRTLSANEWAMIVKNM